MSFPITVGAGGIAGWKLLQHAEAKTKETLARDPVVKRELDYYRERVQHVQSVDELVGDYRMLSVALKAHGLETEIKNRGLIKKVLESDLSDPRSLANRLTDKRYLRLAESFDFNGKSAGGVDSSIPPEERIGLKGYSKEVYGFSARQKDKLVELAANSKNDFAFWKEARISPSLVNMFTVALNLPVDFGKSEKYTDKAGNENVLVTKKSRPAVEKIKILKALEEVTGARSFEDLAKPEIAEKLLRAFVFNDRDNIIRSKIEADAEKRIGDKSPEPELEEDFIRRVGLTGFDKDQIKATEEARDAFKKILETKDRDPIVAFHLLRNDGLKDVLQNTLDLGEDFEKLSSLEKMEALTDAAKKTFNIESWNDLADPEKIEHVFRRHVFRLRTAEPIEDSSKPDQVEAVATAYLDREFESRVGLGDESLRFALNARRELARLGQADRSDRAKWFEVLGNPPLRQVFQAAFGFGSYIGALDIDRQLTEYTNASKRILGTDSFKDISGTETTERLVKTYLARSQTDTSHATNRYSAALTLLSGPAQFF